MLGLLHRYPEMACPKLVLYSSVQNVSILHSITASEFLCFRFFSFYGGSFRILGILLKGSGGVYFRRRETDTGKNILHNCSSLYCILTLEVIFLTAILQEETFSEHLMFTR